MGKFTFQKQHIAIQIEDNHFDIPYSQDLFSKRDNVLKNAELKMAALEGVSDKKALSVAERFCKEATDELLGEDAFNKVFSGRDQDVIEMVDVIYYIISEISAFEQNRYPKKQTAAVSKPKTVPVKKHKKKK